MDNEQVSKKSIVWLMLFGLMIVVGIFIRTQIKRSTTIVFCNVGQGDAAYIRTKEGVDIVIDAGPNNSVSECLGKHMPFYDHTIELAFLSHPQKDHYGGYEALLDHYKIRKFITVPVESDNESYISLRKKLKSKKVPVIYLFSGDRLKLGSNASIRFIWPTRDYIEEKKDIIKTVDPNFFSQIFVFRYGLFDSLFTGDISKEVLSSLSDSELSFPDRLEVLKVPHHGSKTGLSREVLELADPVVSVIMVKLKNRYHHPSPEVIAMFEALKKTYLRTSTDGEVVVETDGKKFTVKANHFNKRFLMATK